MGSKLEHEFLAKKSEILLQFIHLNCVIIISDMMEKTIEHKKKHLCKK